MPKKIFIEGSEPNQLPEWQSLESISKSIRETKTGDIAHIALKGEKLEYYLKNLGVNQIHGCTDDASSQQKLTIWSTYFAINPDAFMEDEPRSFTAQDIRLIELEKAEEYIERASEGQFSYGSEVQVKIESGVFVITVDSFFNGIVSGLTADGQRITGGANFFKPYK